MEQAQDQVSIEASNGWFFAILLSLAAPWIFLPDHLASWVVGLVFLAWIFLALAWMRKEYLVFKRSLSSLDDRTLSTIASNRRVGSIRQRAARRELDIRAAHPRITQ